MLGKTKAFINWLVLQTSYINLHIVVDASYSTVTGQ